jgi:hypothetical protein
MPETFSKSRAQEMSMEIRNLSHRIDEDTKKLAHLRAELRTRCPHPDEFVVKLDVQRQNKLFKPVEYWTCKLCQINMTRKGN